MKKEKTYYYLVEEIGARQDKQGQPFAWIIASSHLIKDYLIPVQMPAGKCIWQNPRNNIVPYETGLYTAHRQTVRRLTKKEVFLIAL